MMKSRKSSKKKKPIQTKLASVQKKGWTLAALADELDLTVSTLEKWKAGDRKPANEKAVLFMLGHIGQRKRIPKQRRYDKGSRKLKRR